MYHRGDAMVEGEEWARPKKSKGLESGTRVEGT
jgi:hypothetical protein